MNETEQAFTDAFARVDRVPIPGPALEPIALAARSASGRRTPGGRGPARLLAVAAALALVAGVAGIAFWQPWTSRLAAVPVATPARTPVVRTPTPTPPPANNLAGESVWNVVEVAGVPAVGSSSGEVPYLEFDTGERTMRLGGPCPDVQVGYRQDDAGLRFTLDRTAPGCGDRKKLAAQQERLWTALADTRAFTSTGGVLTLLDAAGEAVLVAHDDAGYPQPTPAPSGVSPEGEVRVAIHNATDRDFDAVRVVFPSGEEVDYGPLAAHRTSSGAVVGTAYSYAWLKVTAGKRSWVYEPIDYVGESPLGPGEHTYEIVLTDGRLDVRLR